MRALFIVLLLTINYSAMAQSGKANTIKKTFNRETTVSIHIQADPTIIWALLTNAEDYPRWNTTVISIDGDIRKGEKIRLVSTLDSSRTFKLKVKEFLPAKKLVWGDGMGIREYLLIPQNNGTTLFTMSERIGGLMFPLFANKIPSFDASFEQFAKDLKQEAETIMKA